MNKTELIAARNAAGAAYKTAAQAYVDAWINLHALDLAGGNGHVAVSSNVPSFPETVQVIPHREFMPDASVIHGRASDRANEKHAAILATIAD